MLTEREGAMRTWEETVAAGLPSRAGTIREERPALAPLRISPFVAFTAVPDNDDDVATKKDGRAATTPAHLEAGTAETTAAATFRCVGPDPTVHATPAHPGTVGPGHGTCGRTTCAARSSGTIRCWT